MANLIHFHRLLIVAGIVFCAGFALLQFGAFLREGSTGALVLGTGFSVAAASLTYYLSRLRHFLGLPPAGARRNLDA